MQGIVDCISGAALSLAVVDSQQGVAMINHISVADMIAVGAIAIAELGYLICASKQFIIVRATEDSNLALAP